VCLELQVKESRSKGQDEEHSSGWVIIRILRIEYIRIVIILCRFEWSGGSEQDATEGRNFSPTMRDEKTGCPDKRMDEVAEIGNRKKIRLPHLHRGNLFVSRVTTDHDNHMIRLTIIP